MEGLHHEPESGWTIDSYLEVGYNDETLKLSWANTMWHRHLVGEGRYDYIQHLTEEGELIEFFADNEDLVADLERNSFPSKMMPFVEPELIKARRTVDINEQVNEFSSILEDVVYVEDLEG